MPIEAPGLPARLADALRALSAERPESIEALRALYDPSVVFRDPIQTIHGVDGFLAMNRRLLARARAIAFDVTAAGGGPEEAFLTWTMTARPRVGPSVAVDGATHVRTRAGLVAYHRDYWDMGELFASAVPGGAAVLRLLRKPLA